MLLLVLGLYPKSLENAYTGGLNAKHFRTKFLFHWATGPARVNPGGPASLNGQSIEMMDCWVSKVTNYNPEPKYEYAKPKLAFIKIETWFLAFEYLKNHV